MDPVLYAFLQNTFVEATALAEKSDMLHLIPLPPLPPSTYLCEFDVHYLRRLRSGVVEIAPGPVLTALHFPEDYLRSTDPRLYLKVASILTPDLTHPNVGGTIVCLGSAFAPGTPLTALLWELYDIVTYQNVTVDERNALNPEACRLLREHAGLLAQFQLKPFLRRAHKLKITMREI
jgi:hypothetical protein